MDDVIRWFDDLDRDDVPQVGGKNASLGEMIGALRAQGVRVPMGFATTADAYRAFVADNELEGRLREALGRLAEDGGNLEEVGRRLRSLFRGARLPEPVEQAVREAYRELGRRHEREDVDVAVRSSATAEDLPEASFAGQQETFLNVRGEDELLDAVRRCYASLFTDRAISYREEHGFDHLEVALSVGVQKMVRADRAGAGVMFTIDTDTGFPDVVVIDAVWGLGETAVQGTVDPDEWRVFKPVLDREELEPILSQVLGTKARKMVYARGGSHTTKTVDTSDRERETYVLDDGEVLQLARWAVAIEEHYGRPMDIEWAKDGHSGRLFVVQARPETVQSQEAAATLKTHRLEEEPEEGSNAVRGVAIGQAIASGPVRRIEDPEDGHRFEDGDVIVTEMTDPDWVPLMRRAAAIVTDTGGRTCHAAIVGRELGIPAVVGTGDATEVLEDGEPVTVVCSGGEEGRVLRGEWPHREEEIDLDQVPETRTRVKVNVASPDAAMRWWRLPSDGVGLARMEFVINHEIQIHPMALVRFDELEDEQARRRIEERTRGYADKTEYFVERLARGIARIAAPHHPNPVLVRMSDFKSNEYADLIGGAAFEPGESNPMLGFRGASRYYSDEYREGFALECRAIRFVRERIGMDNVQIMIPFCRTVEEAERVLEVLAEEGLRRGRGGLEIHVMAEVPSNVILADRFSRYFDGFSIGSNDLTQLVLGVDRDSMRLSRLFDEHDLAVERQIRNLIDTAHGRGRPVGLCGQAPSDHPDFAAFLVRCRIDSISVDPDSLLDVRRVVAETERGTG